jgi:hypothetical protein
MRHTVFHRGVGDGLAGLHLVLFRGQRPGVHAVHAVDAVDAAVDRRGFLQRARDHLRACGRQCPSPGAVRTASQDPHLPSVGEQAVRDRPALLTGRAGDENKLVHVFSVIGFG